LVSWHNRIWRYWWFRSL